jgi:hypothetical protein
MPILIDHQLSSGRAAGFFDLNCVADEYSGQAQTGVSYSFGNAVFWYISVTNYQRRW